MLNITCQAAWGAKKQSRYCCQQRISGLVACRPPYSSCRTPQTKRELLGVRYAVQGVDGYESIDELAPHRSNEATPSAAEEAAFR